MSQRIPFLVTDCEYQSFMANVRWFIGSRRPEVSREFDQ
jgi:hypothetical protein